MPEAAAPAAPTGGATPAVSTTTATDGPPAGLMPGINWDSLDDDSKIVETMRAEHFAKPAEAPATESTPDPKAGKRGKNGQFQSAPGAVPSSAASAPDAGASTPPAASAPAGSVSFETPQAAIDAICQAIETWDPDALSKATGKPRTFFEAGDAKWAAFRSERQAFNAEKRTHAANVAAVEERARSIESLRLEAKAEFGAAIKAAEAYKQGDFESFAKLVEELTGDTYDVAQANVIQGALSSDPIQKRMRQQLAQAQSEIAALKKKGQATEQTAEQQQAERHQRAYEATIAALESDLGTHEAKTLKNYQRDILGKIRDSWDGKAYTMSFLDAADELVAERDEENAARGFAKAPRQLPAASATPRTPPALPPRGAAASGGAPVKPRWETEDMSDEELIASIEADRKAGRLK